MGRILILAVLTAAIVPKFTQSRWKKVFHRELNFLEHFTRITGGIFTFLIRDTEIVCRNHHLDFTLQLNDGKQTECNIDLFAYLNILEVSANLCADLAWDHRAWTAGFCRTLHIAAGKTEKITATVQPPNATNQSVSWESDKTGVATVADGTVTGVAAGEAKITVKTGDGNKTASCTVKVTEAVAGVSI